MNYKIKNIIIGISEKADGNMRLAVADDKSVYDNRKKFFKKLGVEMEDVVWARLANSKKAAIINKDDSGGLVPNTDALITQEKNLILTITVADCLPVFFYVDDKHVIGLAHAGWRGLEKNIISGIIALMKKNFKINARKLQVFIGPHICRRHYEVKDDVFKKFKEYKQARSMVNGKKYLDLDQVVAEQLKNLGVVGRNIKISSECTYELKNKYFSYRRERSKPLKAMVAYIMFKNN